MKPSSPRCEFTIDRLFVNRGLMRIVLFDARKGSPTYKLVNEFNRGYRGYRRTYRSCTKSAKTAIERFLEEGEQISKAMLAENR